MATAEFWLYCESAKCPAMAFIFNSYKSTIEAEEDVHVAYTGALRNNVKLSL
jgi:hypothetical protein